MNKSPLTHHHELAAVVTPQSSLLTHYPPPTESSLNSGMHGSFKYSGFQTQRQENIYDKLIEKAF
jgi:hypothetical protein